MVSQHVNYTRNSYVLETRGWLDAEEDCRYTEPTAEMRDTLSGHALSLDDRIDLAVNMPWIGTYISAKGAVTCFEDLREGWTLLKRGFLYYYWDCRIEARAADFWDLSKIAPDEAFFGLAKHYARDGALGLALGTPEATWLLEHVDSSLENKCLGWLSDDFYAPYMLRLYRKLVGKADVTGVPSDPEGWEHPFVELVDNWDDGDSLAESIFRMCEYHMRWNRGDSPEHEAEFSAPYAILNPIEIHALEAIRRELGLATPQVEHELLQPPFYPVPDFVKNISTEEILAEDDLLRRIIEVNQPWCDGLED